MSDSKDWEAGLKLGNWVLWERPSKRGGQQKSPVAVTITKTGIFVLSREARTQLKADHVVFLVDKEGRRIAIQRTDASNLARRKVNQRVGNISMLPLVKQFKLKPGRRAAEIHGDYLVFSMDGDA